MTNKYLTKISSDLAMARKSDKEEREAIRAYTNRITKAKDPALLHALRHALGEERDHAKGFEKVIEKEAHNRRDILVHLAMEGYNNNPYNYNRRDSRRDIFGQTY